MKKTSKKSSVSIVGLMTYLSILVYGPAFAQLESLGNVIPPSPRSVDFNKFIDHKVSLVNGIPEIAINFYTINLDNISIPIGISYHASGIKYGQTSGDVGLGWSMNPGYRISRTVKGRVDEFYSMPNMQNGFSVNGVLNQSITFYLGNNFTSPIDRDKYIARYANPREQPVFTALQGDYLDGQFDDFTMATPSEEAHFVISDRANKKVSLLTNSATKVKYSTGISGISGFDLVDMAGINYKFGFNVANGERIIFGTNKYSTAWMLSNIRSPLGKNVDFHYAVRQESSVPKPFYSRMLRDVETSTCLPSVDDGGTTSYPSSTSYDISVLTEINGPNENIFFSRNVNGTINQILIKRLDGTTIKQVDFFYSSFYSKTFLDSIGIAGSDNLTVEKYKFEYTAKNENRIYYDCFGYYQQTATNGHAYRYGNLLFLQDCGGLTTNKLLDGTNKEQYATTSAYLLNRITYPTGGYTNYKYESNRYRMPGNTTTVMGGGVRILAIDSYSATGEVALRKSYAYGSDGSGYGVMRFNPVDKSLYIKEQPYLIVPHPERPGVVSTQIRNHSSFLDGELFDEYVQANLGWYDTVREMASGGENHTTDYIFDMPVSDLGVSPYLTNHGYEFNGLVHPVEFPMFFVGRYDYWNKPYLKEKVFYKTVGADKVPLVRELYEYLIPSTIPAIDDFTGFRVNAFAKADGGLIAASPTMYNPYNDVGINSLFNYATYKVTRADVLLKEENYDTISGRRNCGPVQSRVGLYSGQSPFFGKGTFK
ncbi:hypothetical protein [Parapedobacter sp. DT-150]|uniref:hypothetical protein n=1 Tax=Parapedobacter sp. DT-150 TaxID=3396162 RepID=UPI003F1BE4CA